MWEHLPLGLEGKVPDNPYILEFLQASSILSACPSLIHSRFLSPKRPLGKEK